MPVWLVTLLFAVLWGACGFLIGRWVRRHRRSRRRPEHDAPDPGHRHVEVILHKVTPSRLGTGWVNYGLVCGLCDMPWIFTDARMHDNITVTCPRCGARERIDAVKAAMRDELRHALSDPPTIQ